MGRRILCQRQCFWSALAGKKYAEDRKGQAAGLPANWQPKVGQTYANNGGHDAHGVTREGMPGGYKAGTRVTSLDCLTRGRHGSEGNRKGGKEGG